jgi:hypothetical protein
MEANRTLKTLIGLLVVAAPFGCSAGVGGAGGEATPETSSPTSAPVEREATTVNHQAEIDFNLIARVYRSNGNAVEFYEPMPGALLVSETGPSGSEMLGAKALSEAPEDLFHTLAPGQPVPQALRAAFERAKVPASMPGWEKSTARAAPLTINRLTGSAQGTATTQPAPAPRIHPDGTGACDQNWFVNTQCNFDPPWDWTECLVPWWNGAYGTCNNMNGAANQFFTSLCADIGDVVLNVRLDNGQGGIWTVPQGWTRNFNWITTSELSGHSEVDSASNKRFLFAVNCWWDQ